MWWMSFAFAQGTDYSQAAEERMGLEFDLDAVQEQVSAPSPQKRAPARPSAPTPAASAPMLDPPYYPPAVPPPPMQAPLPLEPNSTLESVTVYRNQAFVTRTRAESLPAGSAVLRFEGLPPVILGDSLSAKVVNGEARIVGVELRSGAGEVDDSTRIESVRQEAAKAVEKLGSIRDEIESLLAQRAYLRTALVPDGATATPPIRRVRAGLEYVGAAELRIAERLRREEEAAKELNDVVVPLLRKLADPMATGREVRVEVQLDHPGPVTVALRYGVSGAGWGPSYNARLDPATRRVELEVFGVVVQATQEDWRDAAVFLATADRVEGADVDDLVPWTLGRSGNAGVFDSLDSGAGLTTGVGPSEAPENTRVVETRLDAQVQSAGTTMLAIEGRRTVRGDGSPQRLPVASQQLDAVVRLTSVPKLAPSVQRRATVRYDGSVPLLPGPVASFVLSDYVGASAVPTLVPGEGLELEFGADERFRVTRELVAREETRVGHKVTRYDFRFRLTVTNFGATDATVAVADQLPRSDDARIVVTPRELSGAARPGDDGLVSWELAVPATGSASVELGFSVTVPDEASYQAQDLLVLYLKGGR
ncbi:MAG: mucoidy inhibitor MuiA family protein [Myxococcota bacterium]